MRLSNGSEATTDSMVEMLQFNEHFLDEDGAKFMLNPAELDDLLGRDHYAADGSPVVVHSALPQQQHHHHHNHHHGHHGHHHAHHPNGIDHQANNNNNNNDAKPTANFADLKPLMPFHTITERVNINGIPGHHYQSIASNNRVQAAENNNNNTVTANNNMYYRNEYLVTSSTNSEMSKFKEEDTFVDNQFDEFEMLMGSPSFGPDTTVTASGDHGVDGADEWLSVAGDEWASYEHPNGSPQDTKEGILADVTIHDLVASSQFPGMQTNGGTGAAYHQPAPPPPSMQQQPDQKPPLYQPAACELVTSNVPPPGPRPGVAAFMPLLQSRLQNGPANKAPPSLQDAGAYHMDCASSPSSSTPSYLAHSPTSHVVSTTDLGYGMHPPPPPSAVHSSRPSPPEFAHTTTPGQGPHLVAKKSRNRSGKSKGGGGGGSGNAARSTVQVYCSDGNVARERTVHNCHVCNRGFLNKSNIKVHLRTHTGEKPFRCEVCQKAFRQKAHLIKHAQIHKRSGRD